MVRETRHLWVGNLPDTIREERVRDHFKRYGRVQSVKLLPGGPGAQCATIAFMDIKSAAKAHNAEHTLDEHLLSTEYYEPSTYPSGSPHPARFPLGGVAEEHPAFERTSHYYERGSASPLSSGSRGEPEGYLRRSAVYHPPPEALRGRPRERLYRNGPSYPTNTTATTPTTPTSERTTTNNHRRSWQYDTTRFSTEVVEGTAKRKTSGSESRSGSQSSRSRSPARSSSGSTRSSDSRERSGSPPDGKARPVHSAVTPPATAAATTLAVYSDDRRPLAICVRDLPTRSSDTSLKDGLFHEYKKHGKVTWVKVVGTANDRYALVCFKKPEDVEKAIEVSQDKFFFGCKIDVAPYHGYDVEDNEARPYDTELDEYHPKATRTLFIGNLEKDVNVQHIRDAFEQFGEIIEIDVKKQSGVALSYAFCQYADITSVVQAMRTLDGELLGESRLKLGFGKSMASCCVWVAGVGDQVSEKYLDLQFRKFGAISQIVVDRSRGQALIFFDQVPSAAAAVKEMRGVTLRGKRLQIDFASRECQEAFYEKIEAQRESWASEDGVRFDGNRARYDASRVRSSSYSRSVGARTPRRHDNFCESPRFRSFEDLSPGSDYEELAGDQTELNNLHKRRDQIKSLLRIDTREKEKNRPARSVTAADQGLVVTTHNHRRRLSSHRRSSGEGPAPLCKRRKTGSTSEDERRRHHHQSGDESRPGTPLIDELPDQRPKEPRKGPLKRSDEPLSLPLPEFAAHCFPNVRTVPNNVPLSPPRSASPPPVPPASSPSRPPSPMSNSSSEISPQSPTLEERIRSLDEKYEQWSGKTQPIVTKPRHHLLEIDVRELQPSDIVKSVLSRPSVFDEDSKRLENVNEKYEPRDFSTYQRPPGLESLTQKLLPGDPRSACYNPVSVRVSPLGSPSPAVLSPAAKGLQYPFPSHPPVQPTTSVATTTAGSLSPPCPAIKTMSKSMEFSVQKAESWLGITRTTEANPLGFSPRFLASGLRHKPPTEVIPGKVEGKPLDPRLDKPAGPPPPPPPPPVAPSITPLPTVTQSFPHRVINRLCDSEWSRSEKPPVKPSEPVPDPANYVLRFTRVRVENTEVPLEPVKHVTKSPHSRKPEAVESSDVASERNSNASASVVELDSAKLTVASSKHSSALIESSGNCAVDKPLTTNETDLLRHSDKIDSCSAKTDTEAPLVNSTVHQSESTKKLDSSIIKLSVPTKSTDLSAVIAPIPEPKTQIPAAIPSTTVPEPLALKPKNLTDEAVVCKVLSKSDNGVTNTLLNSQLVPPKIVSDYVPFNVRDKESGVSSCEKSKICTKEKDRHKEDREKGVHNRESDRDRHKEKSLDRDKERDKFKSLSRDKTKDRDIPENVDKEKKKDRDVEIERRKDRESMEITEREKRKPSCDNREEDAESDNKKDHLEPLDRRKGGSDKKVLDHHERKSIDHNDKNKKKDLGEKDKRKENTHDKDKKKVHSSDKHRKSSDETDKRQHKERDKSGNLLVPATIGSKRRISSQDSVEGVEEAKRSKLDNKRRDSHDSRSSGSSCSKRSEVKQTESKTSEIKHSLPKQPSDASESKSEVKPISELRKKEDSERKKHNSESHEKQRMKEASKKIKVKSEKDEIVKSVKENSIKIKDNHEKPKELSSDTDDDRKYNSHRKEFKEKKRSFGSCESLEEKKKKEKRSSPEKKREDDLTDCDRSQKDKPKGEIRKENGIDESNSDSDSEPKKHSIFDVVIDEPAYISMYDKVKARSTKNLQKQEEERRQGKLKEKFSQLKQSRAKREEKKRSTSWDEDSDSDTSQIRRRPRRPFCQLSSDDENVVPKDKKIDGSSSEETGRLKLGKLKTNEIYTDDDSDTMDKTKAFTLKTNTTICDDENDQKKINIPSSKHHSYSNARPEKITSDSKSKVRLSLDSSTERISNEIKAKKRPNNETLSESDHGCSPAEKTERKKSRKEKRQKSSEDEKFIDVECDLKNEKSDRKRPDKKERRKSIQSGDSHDENRMKKKFPKSGAQSSRDEMNYLEAIFGSWEESEESQQKLDSNVKSVPSKWHVDDIYSDPEVSDKDSMQALVEQKKLKEKRRKEKRNREVCKDVQVNQIMDQKLNFHKVDVETPVNENTEIKTKVNKEKKKKRKKSKDEKSNRHHHHHYHHDKSEPAPARIEEASPSLPNLTDLSSTSSRPRTPSPSRTMPLLTKAGRKEKAHIFGCDNDEKQDESAVQSISLSETPKSTTPVREILEERENTKERTIISQEETEVAVAALLGETFSYGSHYSGSPPVEPEQQAPHDEEEMRQAVQSLNSDVKPGTPQSDSDLQIDTDAEESEELPNVRFDFIPRTPDVDSGPPKTPDISPAYMTPNKSFVRKDTTRNSRDEMDINVETSPVPFTDSDAKPPVLKPPSPKLAFRDEPPAIEPQIPKSTEKVFVENRENRLLLAPPPLVPVSKHVAQSPPRSSANIAIVRPIISLSSTPPTLVLTPIRTTTATTPVHSTPLPRKTYALASPGSIITTRVAIPPPVLSPVTPNPVSMPKVTSPSYSQTVPGNGAMFSSASTIVTSRQIPAHLVSQKLIVSSPRVSVVQARANPTQTESVVVRPRPPQPDMPPLSSPEAPHTRPAIPPALSPAISHTSTPVITHSAAQSATIRPTAPQQTAPVQQQPPVPPPPPPIVPPTQPLPVVHPPPQLVAQTSTPAVVNAPQPVVTQPSPVPGSVPSLVLTKPVIGSVPLPPFQYAQKAVYPAAAETSTIVRTPTSVEPSKAEVSVICPKPVDKVKLLREEDVKLIDDIHVDKTPTDMKKVLVEMTCTAVPDIKKEVQSESEVDTKIDVKPLMEPIDLNKENDETSPKVVPKVKNETNENATEFNKLAVKKVESQDEAIKSDDSIEKSSENLSSSNIDDLSKDGSSDDDKPITAMVRKSRRKTNRGGMPTRRGGRSNCNKSESTPVGTPVSSKRGSRGRGARGAHDGSKKQSADVYEFHDESDEEDEEERDRPRLVITIKSPNNTKETPSVTPKAASTPQKEVLVRSVKSPPAPPVVKAKEPSPPPTKETGINNTRKSRRLQEKDHSRNTVDEIIEDVIRNVNQRTSPRRSTRQSTPVKPVIVTPPVKKSLRAKKLMNEEEVKADETVKVEEEPVVDEKKEGKEVLRPAEEASEASDEEPTTLIDPVTGMLMVMRAKEGGKYVPVPNAPPIAPPTPPLAPALTPAKAPTPPPKIEPAPIVSEGLASHWLTQETLKAGAKTPTPTIPSDKPGTPFLSSRPPTPPTTPLATPFPTAIPTSTAPIANLVKSCEAPVVRVANMECNITAEPVIPKKVEVPDVRLEPSPAKCVVIPQEYVAMKPGIVKVARAKTIVLPPKQMFSNVRCLQAVKGPPAHELHPMTGAVASPPPRAPHFVSQQPVVAGASSSRAFGETAKAQRASPRPLTIPPYDAALGEGVSLGHLSPFVHHQFVYQTYLPGMLPTPYRLSAALEDRGAGDMGHSPPLELRRPTDPVYIRQHMSRYYDEPPPAHLHPRQLQPAQQAEAPSQPQPRIQVATPPHASQVPTSQDSLLTLLQGYPIMWQGLLALKNDQSAVQMHFVLGNEEVARDSLRCNPDGSTSPLRIAQRMRLEQTQLEGVARKMQIDNEHCMLLALPCGRDHMDVLQQSTNLQAAFISYLQQKQAAGIVNVAHPGSSDIAYVLHIFPSCDFANQNLARVAPDLVHRMQEIPHLIIVIATV